MDLINKEHRIITVKKIDWRMNPNEKIRYYRIRVGKGKHLDLLPGEFQDLINIARSFRKNKKED